MKSAFNFFHSEDVVRHPVVFTRIVNAYEARKRPNKNAKRRWRQSKRSPEQEQK